jgi:hypothetical protein
MMSQARASPAMSDIDNLGNSDLAIRLDQPTSDDQQDERSAMTTGALEASDDPENN